MDWVLTGLVFVAWTLLLVVLYRLTERVGWVLGGLESIAEHTRSPDLARIEAELGGLKAQVEGLPSIWEDHSAKARRSEERARWERRRAEARAAEFDDSSDEGVRFDDGAASQGGGVQPVLEAVATYQPQPQLDYIAAGWRRKLNG